MDSDTVMQSYSHTVVTLVLRTESYSLKIRSDPGVTTLCILYYKLYCKLYRTPLYGAQCTLYFTQLKSSH